MAALLIAKVSLAAERGIELRLADDASLPRLDPDLSADVGTVLGNLVDNAVDATVAAGGTSIAVQLREDGDLVLVQVADSGAGVPARTPPRSSGAATPPSPATRAAGVSAWRWCRWSASVGAARCRCTMTAAPSSPPGCPATEEAHDHRPDRARRRRRLHGRRHPHAVRASARPASGWSGVVATGEAALAEIERLRPDLVLLDVHLPDLTGIDVLRRLRAAGDDTGVVMVTAAREAETVRAAAAGGAAHYLVKPFEYDDLRARLEAFRAAHTALAGGEPRRPRTTSTRSSRRSSTTRPQVLPKGLSAPTADAVLEALGAAGELSAAECAEAVGISRVSARRYLEHFVTIGQVEVRLKYGGAGRPERRYRLRS